jgi:hypothetical protein
MCKDNAEDYNIEMTGLELLDPSHKHRAKIDDGEKITSQTMTPDNARMSFSEKPPPPPKNLFELAQRQAKTLPTKAPDQSRLPLSWWGFIAWGGLLCAVLAGLVWRGRQRPPPAVSPAASEETDVGTAEIPTD